MIFNLEALKQAIDKMYNDFSSYDGESRNVDVEVTIENGDVSNERFVDLVRMKTCSVHKENRITRTVVVFAEKHDPEYTVEKVSTVKIKKS